MDEILPEPVRRMKEGVESLKQAQSKSAGASVSFHEKLAVLTAGSLAIAVSGAGALYQKPRTELATNHRLLCGLVVSVTCLWLSLISSLVHNFLESRALDLDSEVEFHTLTLDVFGEFVEKDTFKERLEPPLKKKQEQYVKRAMYLRKGKLKLSLAAVSLFALGYLWVVGYVFVLYLSSR